MSRLTLRLPDTLHHQLANLADTEGVSLNHYIVYALTRQSTAAYTVRAVPSSEIEEQRMAFESLVDGLGRGGVNEVRSVLDEREEVPVARELGAAGSRKARGGLS